MQASPAPPRGAPRLHPTPPPGSRRVQKPIRATLDMDALAGSRGAASSAWAAATPMTPIRSSSCSSGGANSHRRPATAAAALPAYDFDTFTEPELAQPRNPRVDDDLYVRSRLVSCGVVALALGVQPPRPFHSVASSHNALLRVQAVLPHGSTVCVAVAGVCAPCCVGCGVQFAA